MSAGGKKKRDAHHSAGINSRSRPDTGRLCFCVPETGLYVSWSAVNMNVRDGALVARESGVNLSAEIMDVDLAVDADAEVLPSGS